MRRFFRRQDPQDDEQADQYADFAADEDSYDEYADYEDADYSAPDIEPFVPVSGDYYDGDDDFDLADDDAFVTQTAVVDSPPERRRRLRPRLPRFKLPGLNVDLDWSYLLLALFLFAAGIFGVLLKQDDITGDVAEWWPLALVARKLRRDWRM